MDESIAQPTAAPEAAPATEPQSVPTEPSGQAGQQVTETQGMDNGQANYQEPTNLSEALEQHYAMESNATQGTVQDTENVGSGEQGNQLPNQTSNAQGEPDVSQQSSVPDTVQGSQNAELQTDQGPGESTSSEPQFNTRAYLQRVENAVMQEARNQAVSELQQNNVKLMQFDDIIQRDENTGQMQFINPDTKEAFRDRVDAQRWLDTQNNQVKAVATRIADQKASEIRKNVGPAARTQIFINTTYKNMDEITRNVFNNLIEPYAINNAQGERIGFSCDLDAQHKVAQQIVQGFQPKPQSQPAQEAPKAEPPTSPAMNMQTSSEQPAGQFDYEKEPTNVAEALEIQYRLEDREKGNQNG